MLSWLFVLGVSFVLAFLAQYVRIKLPLPFGPTLVAGFLSMLFAFHVLGDTLTVFLAVILSGIFGVIVGDRVFSKRTERGL